MINWLTDYLGTGPYMEVVKQVGFDVVDVRNLVDKEGNSEQAILTKVEECLTFLKQSKKVVICCDYGMSRSNSIAIAVISKYEHVPLSKATDLVRQKVSEEGIKLEVLNSVLSVLGSTSAPSTTDNILITGGSGFIGKKLTQQLAPSFYVKSISGSEVDLIHNPVMLDVLVKENKITTLIHLANPRKYTLNTALGESLMMLKNVLEVCRLNKVKLIFISSWEVYSGYKAEELFANENLPVFPKGSYGESKWLAEKLIEHYNSIYNFSFVILRSCPVYGEHSDKPKFIYNYIDKAKKNEDITTHKYLNGYPKLDLLYIDDFVDAVSKVLTGVKGNGIFNIGTGNGVSTRKMAEIIVSSLKSTSKISSDLINSYYPNIKMDSTKYRDLTGWTTRFSFENFIGKFKIIH